MRGVDKMADVLELAKYLIYLNKIDAEQAGDEAVSDMDPMKLQKLLYYCQGYSLGLTGRLLFEDVIEAWKYGPVVQSVYREYKDHKGTCFPLNLVESAPILDDYTVSIANMVMRDKGKYSAIALMKMTHGELAWREARRRVTEYGYPPFAGEPLLPEIMQRDFSKDLTEEMSDEEEEKLWNSTGRELTEEEWNGIALSV
jgi:uncharacterized phage-associated protein